MTKNRLIEKLESLENKTAIICMQQYDYFIAVMNFEVAGKELLLKAGRDNSDDWHDWKQLTADELISLLKEVPEDLTVVIKDGFYNWEVKDLIEEDNLIKCVR